MMALIWDRLCVCSVTRCVICCDVVTAHGFATCCLCSVVLLISRPPLHFFCVLKRITPKGPKRRFDTFFYVTALQSDAILPTVSADLTETTRVVWMDPDEVSAFLF